MYIIKPLYAGDISPDSEFDGGKITKLVYLLDDSWNGDLLLAGTNVFAAGGELLEQLKVGGYKGLFFKPMSMEYNGTRQLPQFMQLEIDRKIRVRNNKYKSSDECDIALTPNVGELAVSDALFGIIEKHMNESTFSFCEIMPESNADSRQSYEHEYIIVTSASDPFSLVPRDMKKSAKRRNGGYYVKAPMEVEIMAPYLQCLREFDIDIHGYMNIFDPYFLTIKSNDKSSAMTVITELCSRNFYVGKSFAENFVSCMDFFESSPLENP